MMKVALDNLTSRARVILSTAGPFHRYGSKLVASCVKNNAHYVDITGENFWVKGLIEKHHAGGSRGKASELFLHVDLIQYHRI